MTIDEDGHVILNLNMGIHLSVESEYDRDEGDEDSEPYMAWWIVRDIFFTL